MKYHLLIFVCLFFIMQAPSASAHPSKAEDFKIEKRNGKEFRSQLLVQKTTNTPTSKSLLLTPTLTSKQSWFRKSYFIDWGLSLGLGAGGFLLFNAMEPTQRQWFKNDLTINYKHKEDSISELTAGILAGATPIGIILLSQLSSKSGHDLHHGLLGFIEAIALTAVITEMLKVMVGRLRPDFIDRCKPDKNDKCTGDPKLIRDGLKSFPSGHSSFIFAGGAYSTFYLLGKLRPFDGEGHFWKVPVAIAPMVGALAIAITRTSDNRHHWQDVLVGGLLGSSFAYIGYRLNYPAIFGKKSGVPHNRNQARFNIMPVVSLDTLGFALSGDF